MSLQLDERRLAMLDAMGIKLFLPDADVQTHVDTPHVSPRQAAGEPGVAAGIVSRASQAQPARAGIELLEWDALEQTVAACRACKLCEGRTRTVFGVGDRNADWLLVGEAPGENEDRQGEPFVGQAGKLLDNMLKALGLDRTSKVYIANVLKCRPPNNRAPEPAEAHACAPYLDRQLDLVAPRLIVALGRSAAGRLLDTDAPVSSLRNRVHRYRGTPLVVTYHPAYLLRTPADKAKAWEDLLFARRVLREALAQRPSS